MAKGTRGCRLMTFMRWAAKTTIPLLAVRLLSQRSSLNEVRARKAHKTQLLRRRRSRRMVKGLHPCATQSPDPPIHNPRFRVQDKHLQHLEMNQRDKAG